jgi:hypothetical protein
VVACVAVAGAALAVGVLETGASAGGVVRVPEANVPGDSVNGDRSRFVHGSAPPVPPDIQLSTSSAGCRSTSLTGQVAPTGWFLVLTESPSARSVDWAIDSEPLGSSAVAPFVPVGAGGAIPVPQLPAGTHQVTATVRDASGRSADVAASLVVGDPGGDDPGGGDPGGGDPAGGDPAGGATDGELLVGAVGQAPTVIADWSVLGGTVMFTRSGEGRDHMTLDGRSIDPAAAVDLDSRPPGRHVLARVHADSGTTIVSRTFVTTGGRAEPSECEHVDVTAFGAIADDRIDDTAAVVATIEVAMASRATVRFPAGTFDVPKLENVVLERELRVVGAPGTVLDAHRPTEKYVMFDVRANLTVSAVEFRNAGKVFALDKLDRRLDRFVIDSCVFEHVYAPAHVADPPDHKIDTIKLTRNSVTHATKGFQLPLRHVGHARVSENTINDVGSVGIRIGSDRDESFAMQQDIDIRRNSIVHVTGDSDANGIKIMGVGAVIVDNTVEDVASSDSTDSEGIYTKGSGHLISANHLIDAGRTQAQITVKSDSTTVSDNTIVTVDADTNGIRVEGSNVTISGNRITGGLADSVGITTKLVEGFGGIVIDRNEISDTDGIAMSVGGDGPVIITNNRLGDIRGNSAVRVLASRADTTAVTVADNTVSGLSSGSGVAFRFEVRDGRRLSSLSIHGNTVRGAAHAVVFRTEPGGQISDVVLAGNAWAYLSSAAVLGDDEVKQLTTTPT